MTQKNHKTLLEDRHTQEGIRIRIAKQITIAYMISHPQDILADLTKAA